MARWAPMAAVIALAATRSASTHCTRAAEVTACTSSARFLRLDGPGQLALVDHSVPSQLQIASAECRAKSLEESRAAACTGYHRQPRICTADGCGASCLATKSLVLHWERFRDLLD